MEITWHLLSQNVLCCVPCQFLFDLFNNGFFILYQSLVQPVCPLLPCANFSCWLLFILITNQRVKT